MKISQPQARIFENGTLKYLQIGQVGEKRDRFTGIIMFGTGVPIYENDIVEVDCPGICHYECEPHRIRGIVEYDDSNACWKVDFDSYWLALGELMEQNLILLGNVHLHPDLLQKKEIEHLRMHDVADAVDRGMDLKEESNTLLQALGPVMEWLNNWDLPFEPEEDWEKDYKHLKEVLVKKGKTARPKKYPKCNLPPEDINGCIMRDHTWEYYCGATKGRKCEFKESDESITPDPLGSELEP